MTEPTVVLETTIPQARVIGDALDLYSRMAMGQMAEIATLVSMGVIQVRDDRAPDCRRPATMDEADLVSDLCGKLATALGHGTGSHFGIGRSGHAGRTAYEVQKALDKAIADHERPGGRTVQHDGVTVRYTTHPEPRARIAENATT